MVSRVVVNQAAIGADQEQHGVAEPAWDVHIGDRAIAAVGERTGHEKHQRRRKELVAPLALRQPEEVRRGMRRGGQQEQHDQHAQPVAHEPRRERVKHHFQPDGADLPEEQLIVRGA